jgi:type II secretory pathway component PulF
VPTFEYRAKDGPGKTVAGEMAAESKAAAALALDEMGLSPVWVREKADEKKRGSSFRLRGIAPREITVFTRQLASLLKSGVPILRALTTIRDQTENPEFRRVAEDIEARIRRGDMLSDALLQHPRLFPELFVNMVRSGEWGGVLDTILTRLADAREQEDDLRRKVQAALAYPILVVCVGCATVFILLAFFMPKVIELFDEYRNLPLPTRLLIGISTFFSKFWYWMLLFGALLGAVVHRLSGNTQGRLTLDRLKLRTPLLRTFIQQSEIARFTRTMALLLNSGVSVERSMDLGARTVRNTVLRAEILAARELTVQQGLPMSAGLRRAPHFPSFVSNLAAVGEESGHLEDSLNEIAQFYEKEVELGSRLATSLLEPILILVVGGLVGLIVVAMLLPIFEIGRGLR